MNESAQNASSQDAAAQPSSAQKPSAQDGLDGLTYEQARDELQRVVHTLETGGAPLEESIALWERGEALATRCESLLDGAQKRLDAVRESAD